MASQSSVLNDQPEELRFSWLQRAQLALVSWLVPAILALIGVTLRVRWHWEEGAIQSLDEIHPGIFPFWHRCVLPAAWIFRRRNLAVLTSRSLDGEYIARVIKRFGFIPIRGSSSRGAQRGLMEMRSFISEGGGVAFTIDGPRGPKYVAKRGPVMLSRLTGVPITPFYVALERAWVLKTWDAMLIPKPFTRVLIRVAPKILVPADAGDLALDRYQREMQENLERITTLAEAEFARRN